MGFLLTCQNSKKGLGENKIIFSILIGLFGVTTFWIIIFTWELYPMGEKSI